MRSSLRNGWAGWPGLLAVMAVALAVRVVLAVSYDRSIYASFLQPDERTYDDWAKALVDGRTFRVYDQSSLPALVMAFVYFLTDGAQGWVRALNVSWGVATCALAYGIGRELRGPAAGIATALIVALYRPFAFFSVTLLKEPQGLFLCASMLYLFLLSLRVDLKHRALVLLGLGGATALTLNVRQNMVAVVPVVAAFAAWAAARQAGTWRAGARAACTYGAGLVLLLAPFAAATYRQTGQLSPTPVGGFNIYLGNAPGSEVPYYRPVPFATSYPQEHAVQFTIEASRRVGHPLTGGQASSFWTGEVLRHARRRPVAFARHIGVKALAALNRWEEPDNHDIAFLRGFVPALNLPLFSYGLLAPIGLAALLALAFRRDSKTLALAVVFVTYTATMVAVWPNQRYRTPMVLVLAPAAVALVLDLAARRSWRQYAAAAALVAVLGLVVWLPIPGSGDSTASLNGHANLLRAHGHPDEARAWWQRSAALRGAYSDYALLGLAVDQLERGDPPAARTIVQRIPDGSFAAYNKHELIADSWMAAGFPAEAARALRRSLAFNWGNRHIHRKLIHTLELLGAPGLEEARADLAAVEAFYDAEREVR